MEQLSDERLLETLLVARTDGVLLRIVSETRPHDAAAPVEPNMEDAYLWVVGAPAAVA